METSLSTNELSWATYDGHIKLRWPQLMLLELFKLSEQDAGKTIQTTVNSLVNWTARLALQRALREADQQLGSGPVTHGGHLDLLDLVHQFSINYD